MRAVVGKANSILATPNTTLQISLVEGVGLLPSEELLFLLIITERKGK